MGTGRQHRLLVISILGIAEASAAVGAPSPAAMLPLGLRSPDLAFFQALLICAVAGLLGGFAMSLRTPNIKLSGMVTVSAIGSIVGMLTGAWALDYSTWGWWGSGAAGGWGTRIAVSGISGAVGQWVMGALARFGAEGEERPHAIFRRGPLAWLRSDDGSAPQPPAPPPPQSPPGAPRAPQGG